MHDEQPQDSNNSITPSTPHAHAPIPLTPKQRAAKQKAFLKAYCEIGIIKAACKAARINRSTFKYWCDHDPDFAAQLPDARIEANETLELAAYEQAVGVLEPAISQGQVVYTSVPLLDEQGKQKYDKQGRPMMGQGDLVMVRKYSPSVLITLLKANMPKKYKDRQEINANVHATGDVAIYLPQKYALQDKTTIEEESTDDEQHGDSSS